MKYIFLLLLIPVFGFGQNVINDNFLAKHNLKGNIKSIEYLTCEVPPFYKPISKNYSFRDSMTVSGTRLKNRFVFDALNNLKVSWEYSYDKTGRKT